MKIEKKKEKTWKKHKKKEKGGDSNYGKKKLISSIGD